LYSQEAEEKADGEAALNEMFQKIYADASDEVIFVQDSRILRKECCISTRIVLLDPAKKPICRVQISGCKGKIIEKLYYV
jgi:hypothetical protein